MSWFIKYSIILKESSFLFWWNFTILYIFLRRIRICMLKSLSSRKKLQIVKNCCEVRFIFVEFHMNLQLSTRSEIYPHHPVLLMRNKVYIFKIPHWFATFHTKRAPSQTIWQIFLPHNNHFLTIRNFFYLRATILTY